jgi:hypothetical protein
MVAISVQEALMRTVLALVAALTLLCFTSFDVRAEGAWCARDVKGGTNCGFHTYAQCRTNISGIGGYCEPNLFYQGAGNGRRPR